MSFINSYLFIGNKIGEGISDFLRYIGIKLELTQ